MSETAAAPLRILWIGLEPEAARMTEAICAGAEFTRITNAEEFAGNFDHWNDDSFNAMFCGPALVGMAGIELAQVLLNQAPSTLKYYITMSTENYEPRMLVKNGFTASFVLPMDAALISKTYIESISASVRKDRAFRTVKLIDIGGGDQLTFETYIYLPLNKKYIRYTGAHQPVEAQKLEKLQAHQMSQLWVDHRDMNKFYQYSAKKLRDIGDSGGSTTEKQEKLKDCVRGLFSDIFDSSVKADFDQGRDMIKQCESIISNYITKGATSNWYKKLLSTMGEGTDTYNHASSVSTFAALFAIGMGHQHPEDLAMAGLFHDLGIAQLPNELQVKPLKEMTPEELTVYYTHQEKSLVMIKNKRIIIPDTVEKAILQHHEGWHGRGFPRQLPAGRLSEESQILSFADQFDYLTRFEEGRGRLTPLQALEEIRRTGSINPDLLSQFRKILDKENGTAKKSA